MSTFDRDAGSHQLIDFSWLNGWHRICREDRLSDTGSTRWTVTDLSRKEACIRVLKKYLFIGTLLSGCLLSGMALAADVVRVAVAANFTAAMQKIAADYEQASGHKALISYGSTGKLYAQIQQGAPFDVFLAADQQRPRLLVEQGRASGAFTYAIGRLVLWSADPRRVVNQAALKQGDFARLALANPKTAPYGAAAVTVMQRLGVNEDLQAKRVTGDSIAQAYQFVATGNAELGFVALAQIALDSDAGSHWEIPQALYEPIRQDAVLLQRGRENPAALALLDYLRSAAARAVIHKYGYATE
jgi:molybdate transport system substrate-binding protein